MSAKQQRGPPPFGFRRDVDGTRIPDPREAPIRKLIFELFAKEERVRTVARIMNERGHRTRSGSRFSDTAVARLLSDPAPEIVPPALWEECQAILASRAEGERPGKRRTHLFSGIAECSCGEKLVVQAGSPERYACPRCPRKIPGEILEEAFRSRLGDFAISDRELVRYARELAAELPEKQTLLATAEGELAKVEARLEAIPGSKRSSGTNQGAFTRERDELTSRRGELVEECSDLAKEIDGLRSLAGRSFPPGAGKLGELWLSLPQEEKRRVIEQLTHRAVLGDGEISFTLLDLSSSGGEEDLVEQPVEEEQRVAPPPPAADPPPHEEKPPARPAKKRKPRADVATRPFLTIPEVADLLGVDPATVYRLIGEGAIASHRIGRQIRILKEDFEAYLASRREAPKDARGRSIRTPPILPRLPGHLDDEERGLALARKAGTTKR